MACYHPLTAYKGPGGKIQFGEGGDSGQAIELPCGRCIGCRVHRVQEWTTRIINEASLHDENIFLTLTYNEENYAPSLNYTHFQKFIRQLRKAKNRPIRYFVAGEYGEQTNRPHWHAILFNIGFHDTYQVGAQLVASKELDTRWPYGNHSIGQVNATTAAYTASYCIKKITGPKAETHYQRVHLATGEIITVEPEMARMSLKPGIGHKWYTKYKNEVHYARDGIILNGGIKRKTPRYYDKILNTQDKNKTIEIETNRQIEAIRRQDDNTPQRLQAKEIVAIAKQSQMKRNLK